MLTEVYSFKNYLPEKSFCFFLNLVQHNFFNPKEMECYLIPFQFFHFPILYPLNTMSSGGIKGGVKVGHSPSKKFFLFASMIVPKNDEKCFLIDLKSSFRSQDI